jgi:hypothetical protein
MAVKNAPAAIVRALKQAGTLSREDLAKVIEHLAEKPEPPASLRAMAYVEEVYAEVTGESRRYLSMMLKSLLETHSAPKLTADEPLDAAPPQNGSA